MTEPATGADNLRDAAIDRLRKKREFHRHAFAYVLVNAFLVVVWWMTGVAFFWPAFPIFAWGIGLAFHSLDVYWPAPSGNQIDAEMKRLRNGGGHERMYLGRPGGTQ